MELLRSSVLMPILTSLRGIPNLLSQGSYVLEMLATRVLTCCFEAAMLSSCSNELNLRRRRTA